MSGGPLVKIFNCTCETVLENILEIIIAQIYKFVEKAAYYLNWNHLTLTCRLNKIDNKLLAAK